MIRGLISSFIVVVVVVATEEEGDGGKRSVKVQLWACSASVGACCSYCFDPTLDDLVVVLR